MFVALYNSLNDVGRQTLLRYARGEVLYCYGNCGDLAEWIPPSGGATIVEKTIDLSLIHI